MKKSFVLIGAAAAATLIAGGWAFAQSHGPGFGPAFMWGQSHAGMGPGMMQHMGRGMGHGMGLGMSPAMMQQGGAGFGAGMGAGMMHGDPGQMLADPAQLDRLKNELDITPAQEEAWKEYANALEDAAATMTAMHERMGPGAVRELSPADRFARMTSMREQVHTQFEAVHTTANELLATLDEAQKAKAQASFPGLAFGPGMMNAAHMGGPHHD